VVLEWRKLRKVALRTTVAIMMTLGAILASCIGDPQRLQSAQLYDQLVDARSALDDRPPRLATGCGIVGYVQTRLSGEPGLVEVRPVWAALMDSATSLSAVCGQTTLLQQASLDTPASSQARQRWQQGVDRELEVACAHLREAASALVRAPPC